MKPKHIYKTCGNSYVGGKMKEKTKLIAIIVAVALGLFLIVDIVISNGSKITQIKDSIKVEVGTQTELQLDAKDYFDVNDDEKKISFDTSKVDLNHVGEYKIIVTYKKEEYIIKVIVEDTTPAVIADVETQVIEVDN